MPIWAATNGGVTNGGLRGVCPPFPKIGRNRTFSPFFCLFRPFPEGLENTSEIQKTEEKGLFPQISSDFLKPPSLKPPFAALQPIFFISKFIFRGFSVALDWFRKALLDKVWSGRTMPVASLWSFCNFLVLNPLCFSSLLPSCCASLMRTPFLLFLIFSLFRTSRGTPKNQRFPHLANP